MTRLRFKFHSIYIDGIKLFLDFRFRELRIGNAYGISPYAFLVLTAFFRQQAEEIYNEEVLSI